MPARVGSAVAAVGSVNSAARGAGGQSGASVSGDLDHRHIVALSQSCTEEMEAKLREKAQLTKLLGDQKKKKMQLDAKLTKKRREVDTTIVQTIDLEKKMQALGSANKTANAEVSGLRAETDRMTAEVDRLRQQLLDASDSFAMQVAEVERLRQALYMYRKEVGQEGKLRDTVQQDLRATRTAQSLMINRLDSMEKRNKALKSCVAGAFNL